MGIKRSILDWVKTFLSEIGGNGYELINNFLRLAGYSHMHASTHNGISGSLFIYIYIYIYIYMCVCVVICMYILYVFFTAGVGNTRRLTDHNMNSHEKSCHGR